MLWNVNVWLLLADFNFWFLVHTHLVMFAANVSRVVSARGIDGHARKLFVLCVWSGEKRFAAQICGRQRRLLYGRCEGERKERRYLFS